MSLMIFRGKQNGVGWSCNLASRYKNVFHGIKYGDCKSTATTKRYSCSVRFFRVLCSQTGRIRRTLSILTTRIEESYIQEITLFGLHLNRLLGILNEQRCHFEGIAEESERDMDWFEETATQPILTLTRNGKVRRPRFIVA